MSHTLIILFVIYSTFTVGQSRYLCRFIDELARKDTQPRYPRLPGIYWGDVASKVWKKLEYKPIRIGIHKLWRDNNDYETSGENQVDVNDELPIAWMDQPGLHTRQLKDEAIESKRLNIANKKRQNYLPIIIPEPKPPRIPSQYQ